MKKMHLPLSVMLVIAFLGFAYGAYMYTMHGMVSERTIHSLRAVCAHYKGIQNTACLRAKLNEIIHADNVQSIMHAVLFDMYHSDDANTVYNSPNCHTMAHLVGEEAGKKSLVSVPRLISMCGKACVYGCLHGMFTGLLEQGVLKSNKIAQICDTGDSVRSDSIDREQCIHGVGHGLADYFNNDVLSAVSLCENFIKSDDKKICWEGLFMQIYGPVVPRNNPTQISRDIFAGCRIYPQEVRRVCMQAVLSVELSTVKDVGLATGVCQHALDHVEQCVGAVDSFQVLDSSSEQRIHAQCMQAASDVYGCVDSFVRAVSTKSNRNEQINTACHTNGVIYIDECKAYMTQKHLLPK